MEADVRPGPSQWAIDRLGPHIAVELWHRIPLALTAAVDRARDAHEASRMSTAHAFGSARWPLQYEELVSHLQAVEGATPVRAPCTFYQLVIVGGHVLVPWCYARTPRAWIREAPVGRSFGLLAREILTNFGPPLRYRQMALPLTPGDDDNDEEREVAGITQALEEMDPRPKSLIIGYVCNAHQGLLRVCWADAALAPDGGLQWYHDEDLPLPPRVPRPRRSDEGQPA